MTRYMAFLLTWLTRRQPAAVASDTLMDFDQCSYITLMTPECDADAESLALLQLGVVPQRRGATTASRQPTSASELDMNLTSMYPGRLSTTNTGPGASRDSHVTASHLGVPTDRHARPLHAGTDVIAGASLDHHARPPHASSGLNARARASVTGGNNIAARPPHADESLDTRAAYQEQQHAPGLSLLTAPVSGAFHAVGDTAALANDHHVRPPLASNTLNTGAAYKEQRYDAGLADPTAPAGRALRVTEGGRPHALLGIVFPRASVTRAFHAAVRGGWLCPVIVILVIVLLSIAFYYAVSAAFPRDAQQLSSPSVGQKAHYADVGSPDPVAATRSDTRSVAGSEAPSVSKKPKPKAKSASSPFDIPIVYPQLVMPVATTHLAIPTDPLKSRTFDMDVLGYSGMRLLDVAVVDSGAARSLEISLHSISALVAVVNSSLQLTGAGGKTIGVISHDGGDRHVLRDGAGHAVVEMVHTGGSPSMPQEVRMMSPAGPQFELAIVTLRPAGRLPAEHYEVVVNPNVDGVLVVALFLAMIAFALPLERR